MVLMDRVPTIEVTRSAPIAPAVALQGVSKTYPGGTQPAVSGLTLQADANRVLALLGPSGCGKTTALRLIAGLERPDAGTIIVGGRTVCGDGRWTPPDRRSVGMVFQDYALFPHLTVKGNIAYGLNKLARSERQHRVDEVLRMTGLTPYAARHPHELSGGQQQRVAIARAIAPRPSLVLLDEPFSNLDVEMRGQVRAEVLDLLRAAGVTVILVTHDQDEAFVVADTIAVMNQGRIHQVGTAEQMYYQPATRFVAQFVGVANFLKAETRGGRLETALGAFEAPPSANAHAQVLLRPEQIEVAGDGAAATVIDREFHGHDWLYVMKVGQGEELRLIAAGAEPLAVGDSVRLRATVHSAPSFPVD